MPLRLETQVGGWLGQETAYAFGDYARICFRHFVDHVKNWITIRETWTIAINGYINHIHVLGRYENPGTATYLAAHHLLLSRARAVHIYRRDFAFQRRVIGISYDGDFRYPANAACDADWDDAERAMVFQIA